MFGQAFTMMSKFDLVAAYKQVPCKIEDLRLQGFMWLGKFFCETRQIFGAGTSVCNYDILGETLKTITLAQCDIPHNLVMRQVDDVPVVSPKNSERTFVKYCCYLPREVLEIYIFYTTYIYICTAYLCLVHMSAKADLTNFFVKFLPLDRYGKADR